MALLLLIAARCLPRLAAIRLTCQVHLSRHHPEGWDAPHSMHSRACHTHRQLHATLGQLRRRLLCFQLHRAVLCCRLLSAGPLLALLLCPMFCCQRRRSCHLWQGLQSCCSCLAPGCHIRKG